MINTSLTRSKLLYTHSTFIYNSKIREVLFLPGEDYPLTPPHWHENCTSSKNNTHLFQKQTNKKTKEKNKTNLKVHNNKQVNKTNKKETKMKKN